MSLSSWLQLASILCGFAATIFTLLLLVHIAEKVNSIAQSLAMIFGDILTGAPDAQPIDYSATSEADEAEDDEDTSAEDDSEIYFENLAIAPGGKAPAESDWRKHISDSNGTTLIR